jgi:hypothetical protein
MSSLYKNMINFKSGNGNAEEILGATLSYSFTSSPDLCPSVFTRVSLSASAAQNYKKLPALVMFILW